MTMVSSAQIVTLIILMLPIDKSKTMTAVLSEWWWVLAVLILIVLPGISIPKRKSDEEV